jgi:hypothetical protein
MLPAAAHGGEVALILMYCVQLTGFLSWIVRQSAELENGVRTCWRVHLIQLVACVLHACVPLLTITTITISS